MSITSTHGSADFSPFPTRRVTVEEYHRMAEVGLLSEVERVELLEGWVVPKMIHNPAHDCTIELADELLRPLLRGGWRIRIQSVVTTADSEPEPDLAIVRGPAGRYLDKHPQAADVAIVIEVAESSLDRDRHKCRLYARAGIAIYWIVNLIDCNVEVYRDPIVADGEPRYAVQTSYDVGDKVPVEIVGQEVGRVAIAELFPAGE
ncbi:MAG: Uma2 family endonuclease [Planctomycetota bacterium]